MSFDAWPSALSCGQTDFTLAGGVRGGGDQPNGLPAALDGQTLGPFWRAKVSNLPLRTSAEIAAARALEGRLDGGAAPVLISVCPGDLKPQARGMSPVATVTLSADAAAGATTLHLTMGGSYMPLRGGEWLGYTHADPVFQRGYMIATIDGGTDATPIVTITPPLRAAIASGQAFNIDTITVPMRLADDFDLTIDLGRFSAIETTFEEWFEPAIVLALRALSLSPHSVESGAAEDTDIGVIVGKTAGSTLALTDSAGSRFKLVDNGDGTFNIAAGSVATDYSSAHSHSISVRETLVGYLGSPRDNAMTVNVIQPTPTSMVLNLTNPGFETGDFTGWSRSDTSTVIKTSDTGVAPQAGLYFVFGGTVAAATLYQTADGDDANPHFDVSSFAARIDTGHVVLQGWNGYENEPTGQGDTGFLQVIFLDGAGSTLSIHEVASNHLSGWLHLVQADVTVPVGTRQVRLGCRFLRAVGPALQAYFDSFASSVTLQYNP